MSDQSTIPRLRIGAGATDGSTGMCGMQVVSWESGDTVITDLPGCADQMLAFVVQRVNDTHCTHRVGDGPWLCPPCSVEVLRLARRTAGTSLQDQFGAYAAGWDDKAERRLWARLALDEAESVGQAYKDTAAVYLIADRSHDPAKAMASAIAAPTLDRAHTLIDRFKALTSAAIGREGVVS